VDAVHVAAELSEVLDWIQRGVKIGAISDISAWPPRQIQLLANRHGFLFAPDGTPYQPPEGQRTRSR
jgi:hypothetical protein